MRTTGQSSTAHKSLGHLTNNTTCSLTVIVMCRMHLDLLQRHVHTSSNTHLPFYSMDSFRGARQQIHNAIVDEFGDRDVIGSLAAGTSSSNANELQDPRSSNTERT